jgi:hypothetical protein
MTPHLRCGRFPSTVAGGVARGDGPTPTTVAVRPGSSATPASANRRRSHPGPRQRDHGERRPPASSRADAGVVMVVPRAAGTQSWVRIRLICHDAHDRRQPRLGAGWSQRGPAVMKQAAAASCRSATSSSRSAQGLHPDPRREGPRGHLLPDDDRRLGGSRPQRARTIGSTASGGLPPGPEASRGRTSPPRVATTSVPPSGPLRSGRNFSLPL